MGERIVDYHIVKVLQSKGMNITEIARQLGVSRQAIYDCLKTKGRPKPRGRPPKKSKLKSKATKDVEKPKPKKQESSLTDDTVDGAVESTQEIAPVRESSPVRQRNYGPSSLKNCTASNEEIGQMMGAILKWRGRKPPRTDEECEERVWEYFEEIAASGDKPSMETFALAMGVTRQAIWMWSAGKRQQNSRRQEIIDSALLALQAMDAQLVLNKKIPESTYIFRAKNFWGMKDQTEMVLTPNNPLGAEVSEDELRKRIQGDVIIDDADFEDM